MRTLVLIALFGGDAGHAEAWQAWLLEHPIIHLEDGGYRIGCRNGNTPRNERTDAGITITCKARGGPL